MNPVGARVKARRTYDSSGRRARAMRTQTHVLAVAAEHFLRDGYAATTVAAVAGAAGVSAETIYKTFGGKPGLIRALQRSGLDGTGPVPAPTGRTSCHPPTRTSSFDTGRPSPPKSLPAWRR